MYRTHFWNKAHRSPWWTLRGFIKTPWKSVWSSHNLSKKSTSSHVSPSIHVRCMCRFLGLCVRERESVCVNCTRTSDKKTCEIKVRQMGHSLFWDTMIFLVFVLQLFSPPQKSHAPFSLTLADTSKTSSITSFRRTWTSYFTVFINWFPMWK